MKHGSLFSGIGGFDLAAQWMGWENVFHCEWNEFAKQVLKYYWPKTISYHDIKQTDFTIHRGHIDILTGGFPCQPYSLAGKRLGKDDDRHLWPQMLRAIDEIQPRWIVGENVFGLINWNEGMVFNEIQSDLENKGYEVWPYVLPACSVDAPHRRDRIWIIAHSTMFRCNRFIHQGQRVQFSEQTLRETRTSIDEKGIHPNSTFIGLRGEGDRIGNTGLIDQNDQRSNWENFPTQSPVCDGNDGLSSRLDIEAIFKGTKRNKKSNVFNKWRTESIKAAGNAIVPQVALQIFKAIEQYELTLFDHANKE